jgi:hypothetical protein
MEAHVKYPLSLHAIWHARRIRLAPLMLASAALLSACGGGGGGKSSSPPPSPDPKHGSLQFDETTAAAVTEVAGNATVTLRVSRTNGADGPVSVSINRSGSAAEGADADYTLSTNRVDFAAGDAASKTVTITILDDAKDEPEESLTLTLASVTGGATIGTPATATVRILDNDVLAAPKLSAASADIKQLKFTWSNVAEATKYQLLGRLDADSDFEAIGGPVEATSTTVDIPVHGVDWVNTTFAVQACNDLGCSALSDAIGVADVMLAAIGYFKASNTGPKDDFGLAVAISGDGTTLAVGAPSEDSNLSGVTNSNSVGGNELADNSGAVYVFARVGSQWVQQAFMKPFTTDPGENFGFSVALDYSADTLVVGAPSEAGEVGGVHAPDDPEGDNKAPNAGAVFVFVRSGSEWSRQAYVKADHPIAEDKFGGAVAISGDGGTIAVGAVGAGALNPGGVFVFALSGEQWAQQGNRLNPGAPTTGDEFGAAVALSHDGNTLAVGAPREDSASSSLETNENAVDSGAVYVYTRDAGSWLDAYVYVKARNIGDDDRFGQTVALSGDGDTLAVGATNEDSNAKGAHNASDDFPANEAAPDSGAVYVLVRDGDDWRHQAFIKASNTTIGDDDRFGASIDLSFDGNTLAVGAIREDGIGTGVGGSPINGVIDAGAVYVYDRDDTEWASGSTYVKASSTSQSDFFGKSIALSDDGDTLAVGASEEDSNATGIDGDQTDAQVGFDAGAVYLY